MNPGEVRKGHLPSGISLGDHSKHGEGEGEGNSTEGLGHDTGPVRTGSYWEGVWIIKVLQNKGADVPASRGEAVRAGRQTKRRVTPTMVGWVRARGTARAMSCSKTAAGRNWMNADDDY